ncbi:unnamed protein product [Victoria cruziana]
MLSPARVEGWKRDNPRFAVVTNCVFTEDETVFRSLLSRVKKEILILCSLDWCLINFNCGSLGRSKSPHGDEWADLTP